MTNTKRKPTNGKPISSHPLFPAVVALWFGALFGLGSLAIRPSLIESVVLATGIDLIVPAAAPPLGVTARILIALVMAALGAAIGVMLALRLSRPKTVVRERKRNATNPGAAAAAEAATWNKRNVFSDGPARRPISAHEELGDVLDSPGPLVGRRRSLAVQHEEQPFQPQELAPLPGGEPQIFDVAAACLEPVDHAPDLVEDLGPLDLGAFPAPAPVEPMVVVAQPQSALDWSVPPVASVQPAHSPMIEREVPIVAEAPRIFGMIAEDGHVPADFVRAAGFRTSVFETDPVEPLFAERDDEPDDTEPYSSMFVPEPEPAVNFVFPPKEDPTDMTAAIVVPAAEPLPAPASLGMNDLTQRLQETMARRRAARGEAVDATAFIAPEPAPPQTAPLAADMFKLPDPGEPAFVPPPPITIPAEQAAEPQPLYPQIPAAPIAMPAALRPVAFDAADDEDHFDLSELMPRHLTMPQGMQHTAAMAPALSATPTTPLVDEVEEEFEAEIAALPEDAFASLLAIEPARPEFVRIEERDEALAAIEPVVIFPGQMAATQPVPLRPFDAPPAAGAGGPVAPAAILPAVDPAEAELALRSALANLQRISGAA